MAIEAALIGLFWAGTAMAATADGYTAPPIDERIHWDAWGLATLFLVLVSVVAFRSSRRTHLD